MLVRDVMTRNPITIRLDESLQTAQARMADANCRSLPVLDDTGRVCGVITDRDVRLAVHSSLVMRERWQDDMLLSHTEVSACMTPDPICIAPDAPLQDAIQVMLAHKFSGMPVVEQDHLVGVITVTDLLRTLVRLLASDDAP